MIKPTDVQIDKIIRTKRKTIALQIRDDAKLVVRAPYNLDDETISAIVSKHRRWVEKKQKEVATRNQKLYPKEFVDGEGFLYLGRYYKLNIVDDQSESLKFEGAFYLSRYALPHAQEVFMQWYKDKAFEKISERVDLYAEKRGYKYNRIGITNAQKRWGSCSFKGNLNFSWRLIMAPLSVLDYVVIHELVHLEERNHAKSFWDKVKMLMPDFESRRNWLKSNGYLLTLWSNK
ncbi:M48 family metallopeptidase [Acetomicrobium hydrogeniformans]|uniref:M48 family metallopeptidase n=1 Tax=Acetomicrobium hydrogeniformans TaxID=649746 RepID=A0A7V6ZDD3_9BACT|nr:SprT family zinc-dependent metalloprotease [Acetomicrobium hydrogeniformans]HHZ03924.1 M48 family metallopeptidase [Acetomicrobium hydrogeniformans]